LAPAVSGPFINGDPTLFARKPVLLLIRHLLQHQLRFVAPAALEFAGLIIVHFHVFHGCDKCNAMINAMHI
jgi:hypothetical protein